MEPSRISCSFQRAAHFMIDAKTAWNNVLKRSLDLPGSTKTIMSLAINTEPSGSAGEQIVPLLTVKDLRKYYPVRRGIFGKPSRLLKAVDGVSFSLAEGETLGLVGESGCGKTTAGRCIL